MLTHRWHDSVENPKESTHTQKKKKEKEKATRTSKQVKQGHRMFGFIGGFYYHYYLILFIVKVIMD